ncbi:outer membrane cobalamin receptor [Chitinophaga skermanii]|uniref:Outer membrane cobalamin receptor n=1 Tax=Chitinophaga skermanii TaxID=331697 RepID=A0A327QCV4_9BACT|nr:TonB-dependent receptor [Chitinophaga skermanii]RAJ02389.1 outer membrane cobalamin receptor [Chitinophaga skermanii]
MQFIEHLRSLEKALLFVCLLVVIPTMQIFAQQVDTATTKQLKGVSILGARADRYISPPQSLQGATLQRLNTYSVADALRFFSGIQIKDYGGIGGLKTVNVRSMGTNHVGVFYDGIQLGNAQNGQVDLGRFSLDYMDIVSLYNGQKSNILQTAKDYSSASSIYLYTKKPSFEGKEKVHVAGTFRTGSFGLLNPSLIYQHKINDQVSASLSAEYTYADGEYKFRYKKKEGYDTTAIRKNGDITARRVEGGFNGMMKGGEWSAKFYYYDSDRGLPGFVVAGVFGHVDRQMDRNFFVQSTFKKDITKKYSLLLSGKYASDYVRYIAPDTALLRVDNKYYEKQSYFSIAQKYSILPNWDVALSTDYQYNSMESTMRDFAYPTRNTVLIAASTAAYWNRFKIQANALTTIVDETVKIKTASPPKREVTPAVFLQYQPTHYKDFYLRAFYKRIFRMPTFNDLYYTEIGNSYLKPEYATQYNVGLTYNKKYEKGIINEVGFEADAYYNEVTDKIVAMPTVSQFRWSMMNLGFVKIHGVDMKGYTELQVAKSLTVSARAVYTFQLAQDFSDPKDTYYKDQILYIPKHSGSLILQASYKQWDFNYSYIYTGERYNAKANIRANYVQPWYTSDISVSRKFRTGMLDWMASFQVNNIFNQYYDVVLNYPMPGTNVKATIRVGF